MILIKNYRGRLTVALGALLGRIEICPEGFTNELLGRGSEDTEVEVSLEKDLKGLCSTVAFPESCSELPEAVAVCSQGTLAASGSFEA